MTLRIPALALGLLLLIAPTAAQASNEPIPGVDIIVKKKPSGNALVVGQSGRDGAFRGPAPVQAGEYQVSAQCPPSAMCRAFRLASVRVNGRLVSPNARGQFIFPVGAGVRQVRLEVSVLEQTTTTPR